MKSSVAVFTREDPFPPPPIQKTWYHPSRRQNLTQKKSSKKTSGPGRPRQPANPLSTAEQRQPKGLNSEPGPTCLQTPADDRPAFQESWPSTDLESPSSKTTLSSRMDTPGPSAGGFNMSPPPQQRHQQDSVLARYVQRFRYGEPRSRADRLPVAPAGSEEGRPFWWMTPSSPPSSPTPPHPGHSDDTAPLKEDRDPGRPGPLERRRELRTPRPFGEPLDISSLDLSDSSLGERWDPEGVQERASRLLQRSESSVSCGSLVLSSEGLGASGLSSPVSLNEPLRTPFFPSLMESTAYNPRSASPPVGPPQRSYGSSSSVSHQRPEEDILFQWRLRRKMEQARHWPRSLSQQFPRLQQPPPEGQSPRLQQPPPAGQSPRLQQPPPAGQSPRLQQPPPAGQSPRLQQPPPAGQSPRLQQPPPAGQSPRLQQPPPEGQSPRLQQPPPAGQSPRLQQPSVSGCMAHMQQQQRTNQEPEPSQRTAPFILPSQQLGSKEMHGLCPPPSTSTPRPSSSRTASTPRAGMEPLLWGGSPGPVPSSSPTTQPEAPGRPPSSIGPTHSQTILRSRTHRSPAQSAGEHEGCPPPSSTEWTAEEWSSETKPSQKQKTANRKQKRSSRCAAVPGLCPVEPQEPWDDALADCPSSCRLPSGDWPGRRAGGGSRPRPDGMGASTPQKCSHNKDRQQKDGQVCSAPHAPSAPPATSPVHQALRQAVSEVLFPTRGSSSSSVTRRCASPAPPPPQGPHGNGQEPKEVVSQLLREAEDSDGDEFEGDSLLQVLRKQRTWVKDQISQVDSLLEELMHEGK